MAKKNINDVLKQDSVTIADKYLQVKVNRDGYTRTHEGQYSYKVVEDKGELFLFPVQTDGRGTLNVMKNSPVAYTDGDNIHFVVNTVVDPYNHSFIRTENIKGLDKGKQLIQAFLAFVEDRFKFGVYNVFVANQKEDVLSLVDNDKSDADKVEDSKDKPYEDVIADFPAGVSREDAKDQSQGMGDTSLTHTVEKPKKVVVEPKEDTTTTDNSANTSDTGNSATTDN